ncbi:hypothetical protein EC973_008445 [Apophysomyces ossiformis]|uniref:Uncharacterized protein n=1 Tax=Apophysomyces ossiformis TaxID=679940 RepID=A0A8H7ETP1_9FUNG|nr:hypothetical protein EC973_008445 [Apophysomyces ossiformis]
MARNSSGLRIDSYNIHRLVISGIMVASKFFSDVFFTNSRYAKVGGLPVAELNALELEFLHLNDFNLNVSIEELQQYGDQLLMHWVREEERQRENYRRKGLRTQYAEVRQTGRPMDYPSRSMSVDPYQARRQSLQPLHETMAYYSERLGAHQNPHTTMYDDIERSMERVYEAKAGSRSKYPEGCTGTKPSSYTQRQTWHIEQHHRLPTPPHHTVPSKETYYYSRTHLPNDS